MTEVHNTDELTAALGGTDPTITLHAGIYQGPFLIGRPGVTVRSAAGEWATTQVSAKDQIVWTVTAPDVVIDQIGIRNTATDRYNPVAGSAAFRAPLIKATAVSKGTCGGNLSVRNCLLFDGGSVMSWFEPSPGGEFYGNVCLDYGYMGPDRGHGDGVYTNNNAGSPPKRIRHNVFANFFCGAVKTASDAGWVCNYLMQGNSVFSPKDIGPELGVEFYALNNPASNLTWDRNRIFVPNAQSLAQTYSPSAAMHADATITNNFIGGASGLLWSTSPFAALTITDNIIAMCTQKPVIAEPVVGTRAYDRNQYFGPQPFSSWQRNFMTGGKQVTWDQWRAATGQDAHSVYEPSLYKVPSSVWVEPNDYEHGRALITIHNLIWPGGTSMLATVPVDVSTVLTPGGAWWLYSATNPEGGPVASGTYDGSPIAVPMTDTLGSRTPAGLDPQPSMRPQWGAFVLRQTPTWVAP